MLGPESRSPERSKQNRGWAQSGFKKLGEDNRWNTSGVFLSGNLALKGLPNEIRGTVGRNWFKSIHFDKLSGRQVSFTGTKCMDTNTRGVKTFSASLIHFDTVRTKDGENIYPPFVMASIWGRKGTLADKTVYQNGSINTSFDTPLFSLDSTFKSQT